MLRALNIGLKGLALGVAVALAGCVSGNANPAPTAGAVPAAGKAVACSKCQITYVQAPTNDAKGRFYGYTTRKDMECPGCKTAVQNFFETGKLEHTCTHCQGTMEVCEAHT
jgi:hypothetical protein